MASYIFLFTATSMVCLALFYWKWPKALRARNEIIFSLLSGACFFFLKLDTNQLGFLIPFCLLGALWCNVATRAILEIQPIPKWQFYIVASALILLSLFGFILMQNQFLILLLNSLLALIFINIIYLLLFELNDSLIEKNRKICIFMLIAGAIIGGLISIGILLGYGGITLIIGAILTSIFCYFTIFFIEILEYDNEAKNTIKTKITLEASEKIALSRLRKLMRETQVFKDPRLDMSRLSHLLGITQHGLRKIIHYGEGFQSFNQYLNSLRIDWCKDEFKRPENSNIAIIQIAIDAGYNSLSTFNRAFKASCDLTPTEYRAGLIQDIIPNPNANIPKIAEIAKGI